MQSYFNIVKRTVADLVPKAVMLNLVSASKEEMQRELLAELYKTDVFEELLKESEATIQRRKECRTMIQALSKAEWVFSRRLDLGLRSNRTSIPSPLSEIINSV